MNHYAWWVCMGILAVVGTLTSCDSKSESAIERSTEGTLVEARAKFTTTLLQKSRANMPLEEPPARLFRIVSYPSPAGNMQAYLSIPQTPPKADEKLPAIVWVCGGFNNSIDNSAWIDAPPENDQSASAFRRADIITLLPSLRGGNMNPGFREGLYGEVADVLAAGEFLAKQPHVDPARIYLGGHSTGGTLALLAAECTGQFRAVFAFGPVSDIAFYGEDSLPFDLSKRREREVRSPIHWLGGIHTPTFIFEGTVKGNIESLYALQKANQNERVVFFPVPNADHFSVLAPMSRLIAERILGDTANTPGIKFTKAEVDGIMQR